MSMNGSYICESEVNKLTNGFIEALKEGARLALLGAVAFIVTYLLQYFGTLNQTETTVVIGTFVLRLVDKYLYETGVKKGLTRF
jgi:hypothetical protein